VDKIIRTPDQIRTKIEGWLIKYEQKKEEKFDGKEAFTLFSKLNIEIRTNLEGILNLNKTEMPALILFVGMESYIVNTTERFIRICGPSVESLSYSDFYHHIGFTSIKAKDKLNIEAKSVKTEGYFQEFGIKTKSGRVLHWILPTGKPGFAFWNVTNKCEIIGRRFLIESPPNMQSTFSDKTQQ
jgi:hypothetical protein